MHPVAGGVTSPESHPNVGVLVSYEAGGFSSREFPAVIVAQDDRGYADLLVDIGGGSLVEQLGARFSPQRRSEECACWPAEEFMLEVWRRKGYGVMDAAGTREAAEAG